MALLTYGSTQPATWSPAHVSVAERCRAPPGGPEGVLRTRTTDVRGFLNQLLTT